MEKGTTCKADVMETSSDRYLGVTWCANPPDDAGITPLRNIRPLIHAMTVATLMG
jgi:hypothetical protein